jgi:hypothetical protein
MLLGATALTACAGTPSPEAQRAEVERLLREVDVLLTETRDVLERAQAAPARVSLTPDARVGWYCRLQITTSRDTHEESWAIVGETEREWHLEHRRPVSGSIYALHVDKATGDVRHAVRAEPDGRLAVAMRAERRGLPEAPLATEQVSCPAGTYLAERWGDEREQVWVGIEGDLAGVPIRFQGSSETFALAAWAREHVSVGDREAPAVRARYSNGVEVWLTDEPIIRCLEPFLPFGPRVGLVRSRYEGSSRAVVAFGADAQAQLVW